MSVYREGGLTIESSDTAIGLLAADEGSVLLVKSPELSVEITLTGCVHMYDFNRSVLVC